MNKLDYGKCPKVLNRIAFKLKYLLFMQLFE